MTEEMIEKAKANAKKYGYKNVEFRLGDIEKLPIKDNSVDVIISNCVGGALLKDEYLKIIKDAGFEVNVLSEDKDISKRQYKKALIESLKVEAVK